MRIGAVFEFGVALADLHLVADGLFPVVFLHLCVHEAGDLALVIAQHLCSFVLRLVAVEVLDHLPGKVVEQVRVVVIGHVVEVH